MAELDPRHLAAVKRQVWAQFPELQGAEPEVASRPAPGAAGELLILTFQRQLPLPGGGTLRRLVRATVTPEGEIVKITSSR